MTTVPAGTNTELKILSLHQPWASLVMLGVKRFETRPGPPNGDMRPDGVRAGIGGCAVNRGDIIGIASTAEEPPPYLQIADRFEIWPHHHSPQLYDGESDEARHIPLGSLLGTVRVVDAYPMIDPELGWQYDLDTPEIAVLADIDELHLAGPFDNTRDISSELPYGDWTPGRWAIELADPTPTTSYCPECGNDPFYVVDCWLCGGRGRPESIPVSGLQGVWRLTADRLRGKAVA